MNLIGRKKSICPSCGKVLDVAGDLLGNAKPSSGDITVCIECGHIMAFADDLTLRPLTDDEIVQVAGDKTILAYQEQRVRAKAEQQRRKGNPPEGPIHELYVVLSSDDTGEGIVAVMRDEGPMPLLTSRKRNIPAMIKMAQSGINVRGKLRVVRMQRVETLHEFEV